MNSTASQSSSSGCDGGSLCEPRSSLVLDQAGAEVRLPDAVDDATGPSSGASRSTSQRANVRRFGRRIRRQRIAGTRARPARPACRGLRKSPRSSMCVIRGVSRPASTSCDEPSGCSPPERLDPVVGLLPLGDGRPPVAEDGRDLRGRPLLARAIARISRTPAGSGSAVGVGAVGDREAEAAEVVVLVVVAVPAAVVLLELERQRPRRREARSASRARRRPCAAGCAGRGRRRCPQAVSSLPSMANSIGPVTRRFLLLSSKIGSSGVSGGFTSAVAVTILTSLGLAGAIGRRGLDLELGQRAGPLDRPARPAQRQVRVVEQLQPERP